MAKNQQTLLSTAAELRSGGASWEVVAVKVRRSPRTCAGWPGRFPHDWEVLYRAAERRRYEEAGNEALFTLRELLRSGDVKARVKSAEVLLRVRERMPQEATAPGIGQSEAEKRLYEIDHSLDAIKEDYDRLRAMQGLPPYTEDEFYTEFIRVQAAAQAQGVPPENPELVQAARGVAGTMRTTAVGLLIVGATLLLLAAGFQQSGAFRAPPEVAAAEFRITGRTDRPESAGQNRQQLAQNALTRRLTPVGAPTFATPIGSAMSATPDGSPGSAALERQFSVAFRVGSDYSLECPAIHPTDCSRHSREVIELGADAGCTLCFGGSSAMGSVSGETDSRAEPAKIEKIGFQNVITSIYHVLGMDPLMKLPDLSGWTRPILSGCESISPTHQRGQKGRLSVDAKNPLSDLQQRLSFLDRRRCLQVGVLGAVGLSLPQLLQARAAAAARSTDKSCIFIMLSGGPSHIDTIDPKPDAPAEIRGPYESISTRVPGIQFTEKLPRLASLADRFCVLRTLSHKTADHVEGAHVCLSGQSDGSRKNNTPYFGSVMAKVKPSAPGVPSYVWLHNLLVGTKKPGRNESGGVLGPAYAPFRIGNDLDTPAVPDFRVKAFDAPDGMTAGQLRERFDLLDQLEHISSPSLSSNNDMQRLQERALDLITSPEARRAFDVHQEPAKVRDRYGRHQLGQYLLMARRLIEAGVRLVSVVGCPGMPPGSTEAPVRQLWDMHDEYFVGRDNMYGTGPYGLGIALPRLDEALPALLEDLSERGLLENTLVVLAGEFGRTPKFEGQGRGRGHWPYCYSALLAGAGVRSGMVYGSSDKIGAYIKTGQPISPEMFGATIYHALGVAPETRPDSRNLAYRVSDGEPLLDIFG